MNKKIMVVMILVFILTLSACIAKKDSVLENDNNDIALGSKSRIMRIISVTDNSQNYIFIPDEGCEVNYNIIGNNIDGIVEEYDEIEVKSNSIGSLARFEVIGTIYDTKLVSVIWNEKSKSLEIAETIKELNEVKDTTIYVESNLPCGMPSEALVWKNKDNKEFIIYLAADGYGFDGTLIWSK